jgi:hypothetical protein
MDMSNIIDFTSRDVVPDALTQLLRTGAPSRHDKTVHNRGWLEFSCRCVWKVRQSKALKLAMSEENLLLGLRAK